MDIDEFMGQLLITVIITVALVGFNVAQAWYVYGLWPNWEALFIFTSFTVLAALIKGSR